MEDTTPSWVDRHEYPFQSRYLTINGNRQHYIDVGTGETLVFVHGTPSWSFDFRNVIKTLQQRFRCVAFDHIGFGLSDKPVTYAYSTLNHSLTLEKAIDQLQLTNITLIMHDFGGPIGFRYALEHQQQIRKLVVLNSWLWSNQDDAAFRQIQAVLRSPLLPFLYRYLNFSPRFLLPASFGQRKLTRKLRDQYIHPFRKLADRSGPLAFARSLANDQAWFDQLWQQRGRLENTPMLLIWGLMDKLIKATQLLKFQSGFPQAQVYELPLSGHFPQEEYPNEVAEAISSFMNG
ncbi:alpha/beta fold hydrolase [Fibrisoma montanum]|uniref:Alpha/beta fold hydrolase n=1 Tax=Fibrisoma montanum TaxID=2305895 RepID=A0A418LWA1_9BACT|nr:alpha/beta fold hydrolase [Fibrisoma montanum]RIV17564.1 alpha/beta fold hydrolase [Fibrisoma montanum]